MKKGAFSFSWGIVIFLIIGLLVFLLFTNVFGSTFDSLSCFSKRTTLSGLQCTDQLASAIMKNPSKYTCGLGNPKKVTVELIDPRYDSCDELAGTKPFTTIKYDTGFECCILFDPIGEITGGGDVTQRSCCVQINGEEYKRENRCVPGKEICNDACFCEEVLEQDPEKGQKLVMESCSLTELGSHRYGVVVQYDLIDRFFKRTPHFVFLHWEPKKEHWEYAFASEKRTNPSAHIWIPVNRYTRQGKEKVPLDELIVGLVGKKYEEGINILESYTYKEKDCNVDSEVIFYGFGDTPSDHLLSMDPLTLSSCIKKPDAETLTFQYRVAFVQHSLIQKYRYHPGKERWEHAVANVHGDVFSTTKITPYPATERVDIARLVGSDFYGAPKDFGEDYFADCESVDSFIVNGRPVILPNYRGQHTVLFWEGNTWMAAMKGTGKSIGFLPLKFANSFPEPYRDLLNQLGTLDLDDGLEFFGIDIPHEAPTLQCTVLEHFDDRFRVRVKSKLQTVEYFTDPTYRWKYSVNGKEKPLASFDLLNDREQIAVAAALIGKGPEDRAVFKDCNNYDLFTDGKLTSEMIDACYFLTNNRNGRIYDIGVAENKDHYFFQYADDFSQGQNKGVWKLGRSLDKTKSVQDVGEIPVPAIEQLRRYLIGKQAGAVDTFDVCLAYGPYVGSRVLPTHELKKCTVLKGAAPGGITQARVDYCDESITFDYVPSKFFGVFGDYWKYTGTESDSVEDYPATGFLQGAVIARHLVDATQQEGSQYLNALCKQETVKSCGE